MIKIFGVENFQEWNNTAQAFANNDVYYKPGYLLPYQFHGDGEPMAFYYHDSDGRALNVFHLRDISKHEKFVNHIEAGCFFDIITPYGYGGTIIESKIDKAEFAKRFYEKFDEFCVDKSIITEFARFHPIEENYSYLNSFYTPYINRKTVYMDLSNGVDAVWSNLKPENRNIIRKAEKLSVKVHINKLEDCIDDFCKIYHNTMARNNAKNYYYFDKKFFELFGDYLGENTVVFLAEYMGNIISLCIIIFNENYMHYHFSGTYSEYFKLSANNLLLWEAAKWGCKMGIKKFHLGGGTTDSAEDSLFRFKSSFSKKCRSVAYQGMRIFDKGKYDFIVNLRTSIDKDFCAGSKFIPLYRA